MLRVPMGKSKHHVRAGQRKHRITHRVTKRTSKRSTFRANKKRSKSRRGGKRTRSRRKMSGGGKMNAMRVSQQFLAPQRDDLRKAKAAMSNEEFRATYKRIAALSTLEEQLDALAEVGRPYSKPLQGRWLTDAHWCPHAVACHSVDACHDFEEHRQAKGRD
jgi:hypothetical protein